VLTSFCAGGGGGAKSARIDRDCRDSGLEEAANEETYEWSVHHPHCGLRKKRSRMPPEAGKETPERFPFGKGKRKEAFGCWEIRRKSGLRRGEDQNQKELGDC